jgi:hypothetical protein
LVLIDRHVPSSKQKRHAGSGFAGVVAGREAWILLIHGTTDAEAFDRHRRDFLGQRSPSARLLLCPMKAGRRSVISCLH